MKIGDIRRECGEEAVVSEEGCPSYVRPSAMLVGLVSASLSLPKFLRNLGRVIEGRVEFRAIAS